MDELDLEWAQFFQDLRDRIAIAVLPALVARFSDAGMRPGAAETAYAIADDMLEARLKGKT